MTEDGEVLKSSVASAGRHFCGAQPIAMRVASFFPFQTTYYLNGHSFIEQELNRAGVGYRKNDNAFLAVDDPAALQAAADRLLWSAKISSRSATR
jgi:hypothetical protein